ncbi:ABC transporter substrate-binding protein [Helicobacter anatolicus]|uniref:ABC transporter substrate-binding protein n=1 Tax=Helicobacter anatolicus TaxID=2905874 RepID=UPI001E2F7BA1|nr:ABC transporter substrate-binding protein [Helicobacter anatolicus]MCE3039706.1 ABC transporter substrate-binding protein [Helicobacter anatolicus]
MIKKIFLVLGLLIVGMSAIEAKTMEYEDYFGKHTINHFPQKIVYLGTYVEIPPMLGIWDKVVGLSGYAFEIDIIKNTPDLSRIEKFPTGHYANIDVEKLKTMGVDLVVTYPANLQAIAFAEKFGIKFLSLKTQSVADVFEHIRIQAKLFGKSDIADNKLAVMQEVLDLIKKRTENVEQKRVIEIFTKINHLSGHQNMDSAILKAASVDNIGLKYIKQGRAEVNLENIIKEDPEIIYLWWFSPLSVEDVLKQPQLKNIRAVKNKQVFKLPAMDIAGPRMPLIALFIAMKAYPERFYDINYEEFVKKYYHQVFEL